MKKFRLLSVCIIALLASLATSCDEEPIEPDFIPYCTYYPAEPFDVYPVRCERCFESEEDQFSIGDSCARYFFIPTAEQLLDTVFIKENLDAFCDCVERNS